MSAKVSTFSRGVTFVSSGETGTQATEFEAAIKSVSTSEDVGAVFLYDTRNDSDSGAWRKKARGSWYDEDLNTATRGGRREFPSVALIVADTSGNTSVTIYDLDDPAMPVWMVFNGGNGYAVHHPDNAHVPSSLFALNGRIYLGQDGAGGELCVFDFVEDFAWMIDGYAANHLSRGPLVNRNTTQTGTSLGGSILVNSVVNDVAATVLEGAEIGALGLPIPTIAVACGTGTAGGASVIHSNGNVYSKTTTDVGVTRCEFTKSGLAVSQGDYIVRFNYSELYESGSGQYPSSFVNNGTIQIIRQNGATPSPNLLRSTDNDEGFVCTGGDDFATGSPDGLSLLKWNNGNPQEGMVSYHTSDYCTGYQLGDIRFAGLARSKSEDRSVKGNDLSTTGTIYNAVVATDSEMVGYSGFSSGVDGNHLSRAYTSDFDFGTGDFSIAVWAKWDDDDTQYLVDRNAGAYSGGRLLLYTDSPSGKPQLYLTDGSSVTYIETTNAYNDGHWHQIVAFRRSSKLYIYVDGKDAQTTHVDSTLDVSNNAATLYVGVRYSATYPFGGSLSLLRISATAPTPQQVKEMYEAEKPLFRAGAKCLLQGDGTANVVNALSFDKSTDLLHVFQQGDTIAENSFRGLEVVGSRGRKSNGWNFSSAALGTAAGGVTASARTSGTGGVIVDLPPFDVRGDTNIADTKLPDDGKIHFTGVTTDATETVIGNIPISANEDYLVRVAVNGKRYQAQESSWRIDGSIEQRFYRRAGGDNVEYTGETVKLTHEGQSSLDFDLNANTSNNCIEVKVTGAGSHNMQWNATVEVQRITERSYER